MTDFASLEKKVRKRSKEYSQYSTNYSYGGTPGWFILILEAIERLNDNLQIVYGKLDEVARKIDAIPYSPIVQLTPLMEEVEARFDKSIEELLNERKGQSLRGIAAELHVSKSTIANWLKLLQKRS